MGSSTVRFIRSISSIENLVEVFSDSAYDTPGRLYGQMAEFDRLTNQTKYKQTLRQCFSLAESISPEFSSI